MKMKRAQDIFKTHEGRVMVWRALKAGAGMEEMLRDRQDWQVLYDSTADSEMGEEAAEMLAVYNVLIDERERKATKIEVKIVGGGAMCPLCDEATYVHTKRLNQDMNPGVPDEITVVDKCVHFKETDGEYVTFTLKKKCGECGGTGYVARIKTFEGPTFEARPCPKCK